MNNTAHLYLPNYENLISFLKATDFSAPISIESYAIKVLKHATFIAIIDNGLILGLSIVYLNRKEKDFAYLTYISIDKRYRGLGLGKILLSQTLEEAKIRGFETLKLEVKKSNHIATHLYRSLGFRDVLIMDNSSYMELHLYDNRQN